MPQHLDIRITIVVEMHHIGILVYLLVYPVCSIIFKQFIIRQILPFEFYPTINEVNQLVRCLLAPVGLQSHLYRLHLLPPFRNSYGTIPL